MSTQITFGKYKGQNVEDLKDNKYIHYLATNNDRPATDGSKPFIIADNIVAAAKLRLQGQSVPTGAKSYQAMLEAQIQAQKTAIEDSDDPGTYYYGVLEGLETALKLFKECN
jgi:hypothetical protein